ncbi:MAG: NAD(P)-dependent oxidoreductase [Chloroflexia bacterium]
MILPRVSRPRAQARRCGRRRRDSDGQGARPRPVRRGPAYRRCSGGLGFIQEQADAGALECRRRPYRPGTWRARIWRSPSTDDRALNAVVADEARERVPVLAVDDVPNCDFIAPRSSSAAGWRSRSRQRVGVLRSLATPDASSSV